MAVGDLGENAFFRSSSPVNNELGRASYADDLAEAGGIQAVMNLADSNELIEGYIAAEGFDSPYYQSLYEAGKVKALNLGVDFTAADFKSGPGRRACSFFRRRMRGPIWSTAPRAMTGPALSPPCWSA